MDTGNYMANQMSDLIENSQNIQDEFNEWLYETIEFYYKGKVKEPDDVFPYIDLTDGMLAEEYLTTPWR